MIMNRSAAPDSHPLSSSLSGESTSHLLRHIRQEYLLCRPPSQIKNLAEFLGTDTTSSSTNVVVSTATTRYPVETLSERIQQLHEASVGYPRSEGEKEYQPPTQYRIAFVKYIIKQLDTVLGSCESAKRDKDDGAEDDNEPSALWYESLESLSGMEAEQTEPFYRFYELPENFGMVKIFENERAIVSEGTTGLLTWEASIELVRWFSLGENNQAIKERKWVLELGCGCGLLATAALKIFPHILKYFATDGHWSALRKCKINLEENFGALKTDVIQVEKVDWQNEQDGIKFGKLVRTATESEELGPGVLLGADIVFDTSLIPALVDLMKKFLESHKDSIALIACTVRNEETLRVLKTCLESHSVEFKEIYSWGDKNGIIYKITRRIIS